MKISTRPIKLLLPLLLVLCLDPAFWEFFIKSPDDPLLGLYNTALLVLGLGVALWYWQRMELVVNRGMLLTVLYLLGLMLESYATHGTWIIYFHVFSKVLVLLLVYATYGFYHQWGLPPLKPLVGLLFVVLVLNLLIVHPEALSLSAFLGNDRGFSATSALLLPLPTLLFLNWYLQRGSPLLLGAFFMGLAMIVFVQHRSVWIAMLIALPLNLLLLRRVPSVRFSSPRLAMLLLLPVVVGIVGGMATVLENPDVIKKFGESYEDITKPDKQGTGSWRIKQVESYQPLIAERPLMGWRLQGFEVPMQFYDPSSNEPMWPDGTGHHFHGLYLDRMFYFGWLGVLMVVVLPFVQVIRRLANPAPLTVEAAALIGLTAGFLVFGLSYDWPAYVYALLGLMLAATAQPIPVLIGSQPLAHSESASEPVLTS